MNRYKSVYKNMEYQEKDERNLEERQQEDEVEEDEVQEDEQQGEEQEQQQKKHQAELKDQEERKEEEKLKKLTELEEYENLREEDCGTTDSVSLQGRTDLALELEEDLSKGHYPEGIEVIRKRDSDCGIRETRILVKTEAAAAELKKPIGTYITLESEHFMEEDEGYHEEMSEALNQVLEELLEGMDRILVAGLGNMQATPDALGPMVVEHLFVTRHLKQRNLVKGTRELSAIAPGVMAQTGMETSEILKGVVKEVNPDVVLVVDALAARNADRLNKTIQISNTGIAPGSGVGNHRCAINEETIGAKVIAIGVPTVIAVPTIINDAMETILKVLGSQAAGKVYEEFTEGERFELAKEILEPDLAEMYVTPKNIDEAVRRISFTISEAINQYNASEYFMKK